MKKHVVLCIVSLLLLSMVPALGCQVTSGQSGKHYKNGLTLVIGGEYEEAIVELNKAIELDPVPLYLKEDGRISFGEGVWQAE